MQLCLGSHSCRGERTLLQGSKRMIIKTNNKMRMSSAFSEYEPQPTALYTEPGQLYLGKHPKASSQKRVWLGPRGAPGEGLFLRAWSPLLWVCCFCNVTARALLTPSFWGTGGNGRGRSWGWGKTIISALRNEQIQAKWLLGRRCGQARWSRLEQKLKNSIGTQG